jgi:hypothetical protein
MKTEHDRNYFIILRILKISFGNLLHICTCMLLRTPACTIVLRVIPDVNLMIIKCNFMAKHEHPEIGAQFIFFEAKAVALRRAHLKTLAQLLNVEINYAPTSIMLDTACRPCVCSGFTVFRHFM